MYVYVLVAIIVERGIVNHQIELGNPTSGSGMTGDVSIVKSDGCVVLKSCPARKSWDPELSFVWLL